MTIDWNEVARRHGTMAAVNIKDKEILSVLCGGAGHNDNVKDDIVQYSVPKRPYYKRSMLALKNSAARGRSFTVFQKLRQNEWRDLGKFKVTAIYERRDDVVFELTRACDPIRHNKLNDAAAPSRT